MVQKSGHLLGVGQEAIYCPSCSLQKGLIAMVRNLSRA
jgi:hypothetical protein